MKPCNDDGGLCVPYYSCTNKTIKVFGGLIIDSRLATNETAPIMTGRIENKCGVRKPNGLGLKMKGDSNDESHFGEFPWMVAVIENVAYNGTILNLFLCGGSLIHPSGEFIMQNSASKFSEKYLRE
jgi:hypothetical protein